MQRLDRPPTLTEAAARSIRDEIIRGSLLPGDPLPEVELSKSMNISRGTVREALRLLQQEGLVEVYSYRGAFVSQLDPQKVREIFTLRALLEPYAVRLSMENEAFDEAYLAKLRSLIKTMGATEKRGDYAANIEADMKFHELISQPCGHKLILEILKNLQSLTLMFILNTKLYQSDMVTDEISHQKLYDGIVSGDPGLAEEIIKKHIIDAGSWLLTRMVEEVQISEAAPTS